MEVGGGWERGEVGWDVVLFFLMLVYFLKMFLDSVLRLKSNFNPKTTFHDCTIHSTVRNSPHKFHL